MTTYAVVGRPVTRQEGPDKVSGTFLYAADVALPGMLWGKVLRSPFPHARIVSIDATRARSLAGVRAVITGKDTAGMRVGRMVRDVPLLAEDTVRFVGEKVAAVAAVDPDTAEEALTRIDVEYEPLPAIFDPLEAMEPGAPLVHEGSPIFASASGPIQAHGNILNHATWSAGDLAQGFRESDRIFEHTFTTTWVHQGYMEPYACVVALDAAGRIQVWANNKVPYTLRKQLADALGFSEDQIVVNPCGIGGDFGGKSPAMNVPLAYFLSLRSGRPVKMIMSYTEELMAGNPRHPAVVTIKTGVKSDGTFWARHSTVVYNGGAYSGFRGRPGLAGSRDAAGGQYHIPHVQVDSYMVYTNNVPCGSYRAPGQPQVVFAVESHTDMIAHAMGIDPYALRLRNVLQDGQVCATGGRYQHVRGEATLRAAVEAANWGAPKSGPYVGRGISLGSVANFAQEVVKRQLPLSVWGLSGQGVEQFGRSEALFSGLHHHLSFLDHVHEFDPDQGVLGCVERFEPQHRPCHPLHPAMILFHNVVEILDLADGDCGAVLLIIALDGRFIGRTPIDGDLLGHTVAANGLGEEAFRSLLVALFGQQEINRLACLIHGTIEVIPVTFDLDVGLVHPPTDPHRALTPVERLFQQGTVFHDPALDRRVVDRDPTLFQEFFDMTVAQGIRHIPAHAHEDDIRWEMGPFETDRHCHAPL